MPLFVIPSLLRGGLVLYAAYAVVMRRACVFVALAADAGASSHSFFIFAAALIGGCLWSSTRADIRCCRGTAPCIVCWLHACRSRRAMFPRAPDRAVGISIRYLLLPAIVRTVVLPLPHLPLIIARILCVTVAPAGTATTRGAGAEHGIWVITRAPCLLAALAGTLLYAAHSATYASLPNAATCCARRAAARPGARYAQRHRAARWTAVLSTRALRTTYAFAAYHFYFRRAFFAAITWCVTAAAAAVNEQTKRVRFLACMIPPDS